MRLIAMNGPVALVRAMGRSLAWILIPIIVAYTVIACGIVLSKDDNVLGGILIASTLAFFLMLPGVLAVRVFFGRALRSISSSTAARLGLVRVQGWNAVQRLQSVEALFKFLWHGEYQQSGDKLVRRLGVIYRAVLFADIAAGAAMIGSVLVVISLAFSQLPRP